MPSARHLLSIALDASYRALRTIASRTPLRLGAFGAIALVASWAWLSSAPALNEFRDAHVLAHYETVARASVLSFHQAPLWDPYYCGGMYVLGTPQARFVSPTFLLTLIFGEARGEALAAFAMILVGLEGAFRYARSRKATSFGALVAAPIFALSGIFGVASALGWINFFGFELLPWIALGIRRALAREKGGVILTAVGFAWCVGFGGTYAVPLAILWCAFEVVEHVARRARRPATAVAGLVVVLAAAVLAMGLAAVRLWPVAETLVAAPRIIGGAPANDGIDLARMLLLPRDGDSNAGTFFVGILVAPAVLVGITRRRALPMTLAAVVWVWLAGGYGSIPSLFALLRELPVYTTLRYPERFLILFALAVAVLASQGVSYVEVWVRKRRSASAVAKKRPVLRVALVVAVLAVVVNVAPMAWQVLARTHSRTLAAAPPEEGASRPFHQARGNRWVLDYYEPLNRGSLSCWDAYNVPQSPLLRGDLAEEERVSPATAGTLTERRWSPNAIDLEVSLTEPATVLVNQNWHPGWRASVGEVKNDRGLLTVALPAGSHALALRFEPRSATGGAIASLVALAGVAALAWRSRRSGRVLRGAYHYAVLALVTLAPAIPVALCVALVHEPTAVEEPRTSDGAPVIADDVDPRAVRLDTMLEDGITLEAVLISSPTPSAGSDLMVELDWRRDQHVPRGLGVFVHIEPSSGDAMNGDHVLLSSVLDLEDAPPGKTLRDVFPIRLPDDAAGKTWKISVGLWRVRRGGARVHVVSPGNADVTDDKIVVASFVAK